MSGAEGSEVGGVVRYRRNGEEVEAVFFDGSHQSIVAVLHLADRMCGDFVEVAVSAARDPARSCVEVPTARGRVRVTPTRVLVCDPEGLFRVFTVEQFADAEPILE